MMFNKDADTEYTKFYDNEVARMYEEHWRDYHDIRHPTHMLVLTELLTEEALQLRLDIDWLALRVMIIYHDAIIKLGREKGWSERMSAHMAFEVLLQFGAPLSFCHFVAVGIRATATHQLPQKAIWTRAHKTL